MPKKTQAGNSTEINRTIPQNALIGLKYVVDRCIDFLNDLEMWLAVKKDR